MVKKKGEKLKTYLYIVVIILLVAILIFSIVSWVNSNEEYANSNSELSTVGYVTLTVVAPTENIEDDDGKEKV